MKNATNWPEANHGVPGACIGHRVECGCAGCMDALHAMAKRVLGMAVDAFDAHCQSGCLDNALHGHLRDALSTGVLYRDLPELLKLAQVRIFMVDGSSAAYDAIGEYLDARGL